MTEREYTPPIELAGGRFIIDTTPDPDGDLEVSHRDLDHVAYLDRTDQLTLRDLLNRIHPPMMPPKPEPIPDPRLDALVDELLILAKDKADLATAAGRWWAHVITSAVEKHTGRSQ